MSGSIAHVDIIGREVVKSLKQNNFDAFYFSKRIEAVEYILNLIPQGAKVGCGGSVTLKELNIIELAKAKGLKYLITILPGLTPEENRE